MNKFDLQLFAVDEKTVKAADLAKVRDVDFTERFTTDLGHEDVRRYSQN